MRVIINGRFLDRPITGVERFAQEVTSELASMVEEGHEAVDGLSFVIARPKSNRAPLTTVLPEHRFGLFRGQVWEQFDLPLYARGDVILNLCNLSPLFYRNNIVCVHDAHPWLIPENFSWKFRWWYRFIIPRVIARSRKWATVSRYSAMMLNDLGVAHKMADSITYNAADGLAPNGDCSPAVNRLLERGDRFVLCLGSSSRNKNIDLVLGLAPALAEKGIMTVVAGGSASRVFGAEQERSTSVLTLGRVSDEALIQLYTHAEAFLFPSFFEGFGIPAIEAMSLGCPVIASNTSAMPEVLGDAAILLDPRSPRDWVDAIDRVHSDPSLREAIIQKGHERASLYSWRQSAQKFIELVKQ